MSVFKNGYAVVEKSFSPQKKDLSFDGHHFTYRLEVPQKATHGTLETVVNPGCDIHSLCAQTSDVAETSAAQCVSDLLKANTSSPLRLHLTAPLTLQEAAGPSSVLEVSQVLTVATSYAVVLSPSQQLPVALPLSSIAAVSASSGGSLDTSFPTVSKKQSLILRTVQAPSEVRLRYVTSGVTWVPSYSLDLGLSPASSEDGTEAQPAAASQPQRQQSSVATKSGTLTFRALIMNDAEGGSEQLIHELSCIAGHPNITFSHLGDPLSSDSSVSSFLSQLSSGSSAAGPMRARVMTNRAPNMMSNMVTQVMSNEGSFSSGTASSSAPLDADSDLFRYRFDLVELPFRGRTSLPVFTAFPVAYQDLYGVTIPASSRYNSGGLRSGDADSQDDKMHDVIHYVTFKNLTALPWTTAPVSTFLRGEFLSQDTMTFVPSNGNAKIKLTKALHVVCSCEENSSSKSLGTVNFQGSRYQTFEVTVSINLQNNTRELVKVKVSKTVFGMISPSSTAHPHAEIKQPPRLTYYNPEQSIAFPVELSPGCSTSIEFRYTVGVRE